MPRRSRMVRHLDNSLGLTGPELRGLQRCHHILGGRLRRQVQHEIVTAILSEGHLDPEITAIGVHAEHVDNLAGGVVADTVMIQRGNQFIGSVRSAGRGRDINNH